MFECPVGRTIPTEMASMVVELRGGNEYNLRHGMCRETYELHAKGIADHTQKELAMAQDVPENFGPRA